MGVAAAAVLVAAWATWAGPAVRELDGPRLNVVVFGAMAIAFPAIAALAVLRPWLGLIAFIVAMPLLTVARLRVATPLAGIEIIPTTVLVLAVAAGLALDRAEAPVRRARRARPRWAGWAGWAAAAIVVIAAASAAASGAAATSWPIAVHGVIEPVAIGALVVIARPTGRRLGGLLLAMGASTAVAGIYNLYHVGRVTSSLAEAQAERADFAFFTYYNVNLFGEVLVVSVPLLAAALVFAIGRRRSATAVSAIAVALGIDLLSLYLTLSKGAWLGALAGLVIVAMLRVSSWRLRGALVVATLVLSAAVVPYPVYLARLAGLPPSSVGWYSAMLQAVEGSDRASSWDPATPSGEVSVTERALASRAAVSMAIDHPLLGVGPGRFGAEMAAGYRPAESTRTLGSAHDLLLNVAAELGLVAAALVLALAIRAAVAAARAFRQGDVGARGRAAGILGALAGYAVVSVTTGADLYQPYRITNADVVFLGLLLGAAASLATPDRDATRSRGEHADGPLVLAFLGDPNSVHVRRWLGAFVARGHAVHLILAGDRAVVGPPPEGVVIHRIAPPARRGGRVLSTLRARVELGRALADIRPDVLHAHYLTGYGWLSRLSGFHPYVITVWGSDVFVTARGSVVARVWAWLSLNGADRVTADSTDLAEAAIGLGARRDRVRIVQFGVDRDRFSPGPAPSALRTSLDLDGRRVVFAPRGIAPIYRTLVALDAIARLPSEVALVLTEANADPAYLAEVTARIDALGIRDRVRIVPAIPHDAMADHYRLADVVLSIPATDGTPVSILEAMACRRPVVASDVPSVREWLGDAAPASLVPVDDAAATADAIRAALDQPSTEREATAERLEALVALRADRTVNMLAMEADYRALARSTA